MRRHHHRVSPTERVASFATATLVTVGAVVILVALPGSRFLLFRGSARATGPSERVDRVVYVTPRSPPVAQPRRLPSSASIQPGVGGQPGTTRLENTVPQPDSVSIEARASQSRPTSTEPPIPANRTAEPSALPAVAGAPIARAKVGFSSGNPQPFNANSAVRAYDERFRAALASPDFKPLPPTQAETDAKWRQQAAEVAAARADGRPVFTKMIGASIPVPLPFGGPSRKQRERDRALFAELKVVVALRQARADSIAAARKADSIAGRCCRVRSSP